ncbi:hypothetical protein ACFXP3_33680 [Streptomyces sp. NPDC059096]|uniref:hypothetical protein n=1 Tax=Streptomyces sp. NPDC059096 TaxID=3346727 RepID=UPI00367542E5
MNPHLGDGLAFPPQQDLVVAHGGFEVPVIHQIAQDIEGDADVRVPLGIGVAEGVQVDQ